MVFQRNTKRQTLNERRAQFPIFYQTQGTLRRQNKFSCLSRFGIVHVKLLRNDTQNQNEANRNFSTFVENFIAKAPKSNRMAYKKLVSAKQSRPRRSQEKWSTDCNLQCSKTIDWEMAYKLPYYSTKATKLIIFQFKLLHRRLATNDSLNKIDIRENDISTFCRTEKESLFHLFWSCSDVLSLAGLHEMVG